MPSLARPGEGCGGAQERYYDRGAPDLWDREKQGRRVTERDGSVRGEREIEKEEVWPRTLTVIRHRRSPASLSPTTLRRERGREREIEVTLEKGWSGYV